MEVPVGSSGCRSPSASSGTSAPSNQGFSSGRERLSSRARGLAQQLQPVPSLFSFRVLYRPGSVRKAPPAAPQRPSGLVLRRPLRPVRPDHPAPLPLQRCALLSQTRVRVLAHVSLFVGHLCVRVWGESVCARNIPVCVNGLVRACAHEHTLICYNYPGNQIG